MLVKNFRLFCLGIVGLFVVHFQINAEILLPAFIADKLTVEN
jgi:hypothetical protein